MKDLLEENYNLTEIAAMWGDYVDWDKRRQGEDGFLLRTLKKFNVESVINLALGDGCDSIYLAQKGFNVVSNEYDKAFLEVGLNNIQKSNLKMKVYSKEWRELNQIVSPESFDGAICMGNSITYLFTHKAQLESLKQFWLLLKRDGILIIDERNYPYLIQNKDAALKEFKLTGNHMYCGTKVTARPKEITESKITFEFQKDDRDSGLLMMCYPFKEGELKNLLKEAGFSKIIEYSDYKKSRNEDVDFYQYVCIK